MGEYYSSKSYIGKCVCLLLPHHTLTETAWHLQLNVEACASETALYVVVTGNSVEAAGISTAPAWPPVKKSKVCAQAQLHLLQLTTVAPNTKQSYRLSAWGRRWLCCKPRMAQLVRYYERARKQPGRPRTAPGTVSGVHVCSIKPSVWLVVCSRSWVCCTWPAAQVSATAPVRRAGMLETTTSKSMDWFGA